MGSDHVKMKHILSIIFIFWCGLCRQMHPLILIALKKKIPSCLDDLAGLLFVLGP